ncbi:E3 ubiquitin protein ligase [Haematospirillum jordaniae]|uniref:RING finger protein n=1 Tax=Haematospirillum jordaniae TaxID=1549855 RepID=UPI001432E174|nr:RING-H2 finger protein [Haematospirillum jordaniae]NKD86281.1 E3 ubiquitin protein ligase [Haematospirillum jordaniae]
MPSIWNGFDTNPHTLPDTCVVCAGAIGGSFLRLPCGHGGPESYPLHVECMIRSLVPVTGTTAQAPRCPICRGGIDTETLTEVADYIRQDKLVTFPSEDDIAISQPPCQSVEQRRDFLSLLIEAHEVIPGGILEPEGQETNPAYYDHLSQTAEELINSINNSIEEHTYTLEEIDQKILEVQDLDAHLIERSGRIALLDHAGWAIAGGDFGEIYNRLSGIRTQLQESRERLTKEREQKQHEAEEQGHAHHFA